MLSIFDILRFDFAWMALIVAVLTALSAALIGVPLVLKRYSFSGFALSNVSFMAMTFAVIIGVNNNLLITMPLTVAAAILLIRFGERKKIGGDAVLAMLSIAALAIGYFLINVFTVRGNVTAAEFNILATLFGGNAIMELTWAQVGISVGMAAGVVITFLFFYNRTFAVTFDSNFMQATGQKANVYELIIAAIVGIVVALSMQFVGSLLTSALIIFPALSAMRVAKSYKKVNIVSAIVAVSAALFGVLFSMLITSPPGVTVIVVNVVVFGVMYLVGIIYRKKLKT